MSKFGSGGLMGDLAPADRAAMMKSILSGITQSAGGSGSPFLAGLAPILAAMIGGRANARAGEASQERRASFGGKIFGGNAEAQALADMLADPNLPDSYRRVGQRQLDAMLASGGGTSRGGSRPASTSAPTVPGVTSPTVADAATERGAVDTSREYVGGIVNDEIVIYGGPDGARRVPASEYPGLSVGDPVPGGARAAESGPDIASLMVESPLAPMPPAAAAPVTPLAQPQAGTQRLRYNPETGEFE